MEIETITTIRPIDPDNPRSRRDTTSRSPRPTSPISPNDKVTYVKHVPARVDRTGDIEREIEPAQVYTLPARVSVRNNDTGQYLRPAYVDDRPLTPRKVTQAQYVRMDKTPYDPEQPVTYVDNRPTVYYEQQPQYVYEQQPQYVYEQRQPQYVYEQQQPQYVYQQPQPQYVYEQPQPQYVYEQPAEYQPRRYQTQQPVQYQQPVQQQAQLYTPQPIYSRPERTNPYVYQANNNSGGNPYAVDRDSNVYYSPKKPFTTHYSPSVNLDKEPIYYSPSQGY